MVWSLWFTQIPCRYGSNKSISIMLYNMLMMKNVTHAFTDICFLLSFNHIITSLTFEFLWQLDIKIESKLEDNIYIFIINIHFWHCTTFLTFLKCKFVAFKDARIGYRVARRTFQNATSFIFVLWFLNNSSTLIFRTLTYINYCLQLRTWWLWTHF